MVKIVPSMWVDMKFLFVKKEDHRINDMFKQRLFSL